MSREVEVRHQSDEEPRTRGWDAEIAPIARCQHGVVSREQLTAPGLGRGAIELRIARSRLHRLHRGPRRRPPRAHARGELHGRGARRRPAAVPSHRSAAGLWGRGGPGESESRSPSRRDVPRAPGSNCTAQPRVGRDHHPPRHPDHHTATHPPRPRHRPRSAPARTSARPRRAPPARRPAPIDALLARNSGRTDEGAPASAPTRSTHDRARDRALQATGTASSASAGAGCATTPRRWPRSSATYTDPCP